MAISHRGRAIGKAGGILNQTGCICIDLYSTHCGLTDEFCLKLRPEFDRNAHGYTLILYSVVASVLAGPLAAVDHRDLD